MALYASDYLNPTSTSYIQASDLLYLTGLDARYQAQEGVSLRSPTSPAAWRLFDITDSGFASAHPTWLMAWENIEVNLCLADSAGNILSTIGGLSGPDRYGTTLPPA